MIQFTDSAGNVHSYPLQEFIAASETLTLESCWYGHGLPVFVNSGWEGFTS